MLKNTAKESSLLSANEWRVWQRPSDEPTAATDDFPAVPSLDAFIAESDGESPEAKAYKAFLTATVRTAEYGRAISHVIQKITDVQFAGDMDEDEQTAKQLAGLKATQDILDFYYDAYYKLADETSARHDALTTSSKAGRI